MILRTFLLTVLLSGGALADPFADAVVDFQPNPSASFGHDQMPGIVLGPPDGMGDLAGGTDVASLGDGGVIVLEFVDNRIIDGPGVDFTVFENPFYVGGDPLNSFVEAAEVCVSDDGVTWNCFEMDYDENATSIDLIYKGMAGVAPVFASPSNSIDPLDPTVSGGDSFDLADLNMVSARFIRLRDIGAPGSPHEVLDKDGEAILDRSGIFGGASGGFDLDAVAAINSEAIGVATPTPSPTPLPPTPTPNPTATTTPVTGASVSLVADFSPERELSLDMAITSGATEEVEVSLWVLLEIGGAFYFHPKLTEAPVPVATFVLPTGFDSGLFTFWSLSIPDALGAPVPLAWYAAMLDVQTLDTVGDIAVESITIE